MSDKRCKTEDENRSMLDEADKASQDEKEINVSMNS